ncbi:MAG: ECF-type sigma factor [Gemmataceae bacterium]
MTEITRILSAIERGDPHAAGQLLPLVYDELRRLAAARMAQERPGQTLDATALVHEAYLRLVASGDAPAPRGWDSRGHFFAAAAEAMRRILIEAARRKLRVKRGGQFQRVDMPDVPVDPESDRLIALDDALTRLAAEDPLAGKVVERAISPGWGMRAAAALGVTVYQARQKWTYARAWLRADLDDG